MNDRADSCGPRNERADSNILLAAGARLDRGDASRRESNALAVHRGNASVGARVGGSNGTNAEREKLARSSPGAGGELSGSGAGEVAASDLSRIPAGVLASVASRPGEYDARRLRSQREIIRDVMISAADCETWLTLGELRALTHYGEASISAQLRHLRKTENGGYEVVKRHREGISPERPGTDGRGECVWEYRIARGGCADHAEVEERLEAVGA
jgi:hypothetical protein